MDRVEATGRGLALAERFQIKVLKEDQSRVDYRWYKTLVDRLTRMVR